MHNGLWLMFARRRLRESGRFRVDKGDNVNSAALWVTKQPYLGKHCLPRMGTGLEKVS